jgi:Ca-activated chloride channel family protein
MPRDGQRADRGIDWATRLMRQIAAPQGQILLVTDQADGEAALAAAQARSLGLQVSVLGWVRRPVRLSRWQRADPPGCAG